MHADKQRTSQRKATVPDLADKWGRHLKRTAQLRVVLQIHSVDERVENSIGVESRWGVKIHKLSG